MPRAPRKSGRSFLYVPGDRRDRLEGAFRRSADALILDLEDAVALHGKAEARSTLGQWLTAQTSPSCPLWVRINSTSLQMDINAAVTAAVTGVVVPKAESQSLDEVDRLLSNREQQLGLARGTFQVVALIETARALLSAVDVARSPRVQRLGLGEADLVADLGLVPSEGREELTSLRLHIVVASAAAGIGAPVAPASTDFRDLDALRRSTQTLLRLGFRARTAIHPAQIPVINSVFSPTDDEVRRAREVLASFEAAEREGKGVSVDADGTMVDLAVVRSAREVLERAEA
jgi:citrate lyase subunit beta/citryl-CoA lyase